MTERNEFQLGDWRVRPQLNVVERGSEQIRIEPRYMDLLVHLSEHAGEVVSADEILSVVWTGIVVGEHSVYQGIARLRKALGDKAAQPRYIETVAKRGYRLIEQPQPLANDDHRHLGADSAAQDTSSVPPPAPTRWRQPRRRLRPSAVLAALALLVALAWAGSRMLSGSDYDAIAVLGFENLGDSSDDRYFAEGLTTELISALGHLEQPNVLGQASSLRLDPRQHSSSEIGRLLHVDAFVSGKVLRSGTDVRVFLEIVETGTGHQVWSATYDGDLTDLFKIQHRIAGEVAEAIQGRFGTAAADQLGAPAPAKLQAYDYYLLGQYYRSRRSEADLRRALELYRQAQAVDPTYASAYRGIGLSQLLLSYFGHVQLAEAEQVAKPALERALELDPDNAETLAALGLARYLLGEPQVAEHLLDQALALKPNLAEAWMWRGLALEQQGSLRAALDDYRRARQLEPLGIGVVISEALALGRAGQQEEAPALLAPLAAFEHTSTQLFRNLAFLALQRGDLTQAREQARIAVEVGEADDAPASAIQAFVHASLGQPGLARGWAERALADGFPGQRARELLELTFLSLGDAAGLDTLAQDQTSGSDPRTSPEIEWRRTQALSGSAHLLRAAMPEAAAALQNALQGRADAIVATDYDLIYCTSLAFAHLEAGDDEAAKRWGRSCRSSIRDARRNGWRSHWVDYAAARLDMLDGDEERALSALEAMTENGFRIIGLLLNDPILAPLQREPRFGELAARLQRQAQQDWQQTQ